APMRDRAALSSRCMPEVAGAARDALSALGLAVDHALDASIDNPLLGETHCTNNAGHMHSQSLAMACDTLRVALGALGSISERRTARLVDGAHCDLPRFLVADASRLGERSGLMIASYTAAALVAELRVRSAPAATCAPPVCGGFEDHGSMSALAARLCREHVAQVQSLVAIELVAAAQGFDLAHRLRPAPPRLSPALAALVSALRDHVPFCDGDDRVVADDIAAARLVLHFGHETL
ncbi:MAG: aromatic amino acid lyase, partial [Myxococcales bacterium]|nr:aromatic amino acid lyase [Myxococcales bacterium]